MRVTVLGAGTMGNGIAHLFAQHGHDVTLADRYQTSLEKGLGLIGKNLGRQVARGTLTEDEKAATLARITPASDFEQAVQDAELVIEAVSEIEALKAEIFRMLDRATPAGCLLASNTSSISITWIAAQTTRPDKVIGMHFFNPVPVMKLVEVVRGFATSDKTFATIKVLAEQLGKTSVEVNDGPGFVSNRVLMPMINEAIFCVHEGVATPEAVDEVMKLGMAHPMGPLQLADFIGLDVCLSILNVLQTEFGDPKYRPCPLLKQMVTAGRLGRKSGQGFYTYGS